jgi:mono/diheme cytochrome c family protein
MLPRSLLLVVLVCLGSSACGYLSGPGHAESQAAKQPLPPSREPVMTEAVQRIFHRTCARCHGPDGRGITGVSPDIRRGLRRTSPEWFQFLRDGRDGRDGRGTSSHSKMASHAGLTDDEVKEIAAYLADLLPKV